MANKHNWHVKPINDGFVVACRSCGTIDKQYKTIIEANARVLNLKILKLKPSKLASKFPKRAW